MLRELARRGVITAGLEASHLLRRAGAMASARGLGAIFTLHHVRPFVPTLTNVNDHLEVTPQFLDAAIRQLKAEGYRFVHLEDVPALLQSSGPGQQPFAAFTLDDGYRNNRDHALPVFERHGVPFTVFVCRGFSERTHTIWWETASAILDRLRGVDLKDGGEPVHYDLRTRAEKRAAFDHIAEAICAHGEEAMIEKLDRAAAAAGIDPKAIVEDLVMSGEELAAFARHPLVTFGAHTVSHRSLGFLDPATVSDEVRRSADYVEEITGRRPLAFAYPYGDRRSVTDASVRAVEDAGLRLAVTTSPGTLSTQSAERLFRLPRISLNGFYQKKRYVSALASGIPFRLKG
ncbi:peptidoglycan/xylan/chitin deacetylase (PgdA/CDA1 family) [Ciceribacter lividus]|uniref:Chitooligosaccharide deacetylase n=1 Tax=Ciceribacter lividus TaxID=1197950 RepID=A0A6I7HI41_9HYPH|nr:polysaccharide deacetylase family protein [Ciceribacter lividus]RCW21469.1 peptidoglycan/xylan/chitin deacetylase (PgdA/CDA1 family) [Ciceribacter lividus]